MNTNNNGTGSTARRDAAIISGGFARNTEDNDSGPTAAWVVRLIVFWCVLTLFSPLWKSDKPKISSPFYSPSSGKPKDMPQKQWDYVNKRLKREFPSESQSGIQEASRAIWEFEKQWGARGER